MSARLARRRLLTAAPLLAAAAGGAGFWAMLAGLERGSFDPHDIQAPALDRLVPAFTLPGLARPGRAPAPGFSAGDLAAQVGPVLVNFFASWCIPCVEEAPLLAELAGRLAIWGIAYKDPPADAAGFVARTGHPYQRLAADQDGLAAIDWGVSGVPESFLVQPGGRIAWHRAGPLTPGLATARLLPLAAHPQP